MAQNSNQKLAKQLQQAQQELRTGDPARAVKMLQKLLKPSGNNPEITFLIGLAYGKLGRADKVKQAALQTLKKAPNHHGALCNLANVLFLEGDMSGALAKYRKAIAIKSDDPPIINNYCRALIGYGQHEEAIATLDKLIKKQKHYSPAYTAKGMALAETGQLKKAAETFKKALQMEPLSIHANLGMGNIYRFNGDFIKSEYHYKKILDVDPNHALAYVGLATIKRLQGDHSKALEVITEANQLLQNNMAILSTKADVLEHMGEFEDAFKLLNKIQKQNQLPPLGVASYANMSHRFDKCNEALDLISDTIKQPTTLGLEKRMLYFTSGKLLDKLNRYDEAFEQYHLANTHVPIEFNEKKDLGFADEIISVFSKNAIKTFEHSDIDSSRPIFILGMPRSGTSLTEQILSSHQDVYGAGELGDIADITGAIEHQIGLEGCYATRIPQLSKKEINGYSHRYLDSIAKLDKYTPHVTDKMPHNFIHIGLISLLFPQARIIHCTRNPLDNILSIYFQNFGGAHKYSSELKNIAHFYNMYYHLMQHWGDVIDMPILTVKYEDMVENQEATTKQMLDFCQLEWDDKILDFHKSKRNVATASYEQVRQPIYKTSKERWKNYEKHLNEIKSMLPIGA